MPFTLSSPRWRHAAIFGIVAAMTACYSGLSPVLPAEADTIPVSYDVYLFRGCTTSLTPFGATGGSGTYAFDSTNPCFPPPNPPFQDNCASFSEVDPNEPLAEFPDPTAFLSLAAPTNCRITASGAYDMLACGTGTTGGGLTAGTDTMTIWANDPPATTSGAPYATVSFGMLLVGGIGVVNGSAEEQGSPIVKHVSGIIIATGEQGNCAQGVEQASVQGTLVIGGS